MRTAALLCLAILMTLAGCGDEPHDSPVQQSMEEQIAEIRHAKVNPVAPELVSEVFALGSDFTNLQRDVLRKELLGSVIEWSFLVYEISYADGIYQITSQPIPIRSKQVVNMLRATVSVQASNDQDHDRLQKAKTNDVIRVRGKVQDIVLRTVVIIEPAVLVTRPQGRD